LLAWCAAVLPLVLIALLLPHSPLLILLAVVAVTTPGLSIGGRGEGSILFFLAFIVMNAVQASPASLDLLSTPMALLIGTLLCAALVCYALDRVFPVSTDRHWALFNKQMHESKDTSFASHKKQALAMPRRRPIYAMLLRRDSDPRAPRAQLMLHALGPGNHRLDVVLILGGAGVLIFLLKLMTFVFGFDIETGPSRILLILPVFLVMEFFLCRFVPAMNATGAEQALVRLAPCMPRARQFNRLLARQLLTIGLREWAVFCMLTSLVIVMLAGGTDDLMRVLAIMGGALALIGLALRNYTTRTGQPLLLSALQYGPTGVLTIAAFVLVADRLLWLGLMLALLVSVWATIAFRWRSMLAAPVAFPAGREFNN
jgi:hypothetical protein